MDEAPQFHLALKNLCRSIRKIINSRDQTAPLYNMPPEFVLGPRWANKAMIFMMKNKKIDITKGNTISREIDPELYVICQILYLAFGIAQANAKGMEYKPIILPEKL